MVLNDTFNNISVCFRGLGLWCLTNWNIFESVVKHHNPNPRKTNWNIVESVVKHHNPNPLKQTEILLKV
jgi:hypothetical protein